MSKYFSGEWLALKVFELDKETSGLVIIKNKGLGFIVSNNETIGLFIYYLNVKTADVFLPTTILRTRFQTSLKN